MNPERSEAEVFAELAALAREPGYIHAIANISFRDNFISYTKQLKAASLQKLYGTNRLIRTELTTVLGLVARGPIDYAQPPSAALQEYISRTDRLMAELQQAIGQPMRKALTESFESEKKDAGIWKSEALREPIFYGGESAYGFQYRDFAAAKYHDDNDWLIRNKGFSIEQAQTIARAMCNILDTKAAIAFSQSKRSGIRPESWLDIYEQSPEEVATASAVAIDTVRAFLAAFTLPGDNRQFESVSDFNELCAAPLLPGSGHGILLFHHYLIYEPLYESPFYWMMGDKAYRPTAAKNRGAFTETFTAERLAQVFGTESVHKNVLLTKKRGFTEGEIDVFVVFGDRALVVQTKSKKLTLEARRGNDNRLKEDFAAAIQDSYDQGWNCSQLLLGRECRVLRADGSELSLPEIKEVLLCNVISDHYPALAFQARQFLKLQVIDKILPPFVMDVFLLDALCEMLNTPLRWLSYARLRVENLERLALGHEITALAFHLKRNLWIEPEFNMVWLGDDIAVDLDTAMIVRRENLPGARTPDGILTRLAGTLYESLIQQIEKQPEPVCLELGFALLRLGEKSCRNIHLGLQGITRRARLDGRLHDFSTGGDDAGFTFHCNPAVSADAMAKLRGHCELKKYQQRARRWFGVSVNPNGGLQFAVALDHEWQKSDEMDSLTANMQQAVPADRLPELVQRPLRIKIGRNEPCPCGSDMKFKKCCLRRGSP